MQYNWWLSFLLSSLLFSLYLLLKINLTIIISMSLKHQRPDLWALLLYLSIVKDMFCVTLIETVNDSRKIGRKTVSAIAVSVILKVSWWRRKWYPTQCGFQYTHPWESSLFFSQMCSHRPGQDCYIVPCITF